jgi:hypothetical protein
MKNKKVIILSPIILFIIFVIIIRLHNASIKENEIISACEIELRYSPIMNDYFTIEYFQEDKNFYVWSYDRTSNPNADSQWYKNKKDFMEV